MPRRRDIRNLGVQGFKVVMEGRLKPDGLERSIPDRVRLTTAIVLRADELARKMLENVCKLAEGKPSGSEIRVELSSEYHEVHLTELVQSLRELALNYGFHVGETTETEQSFLKM